MNAPNNMADKFVLLFSADWFRPHWALTGFVPKDGDSAALQREARDLVDRMMGDTACYWHIDPTEGRRKETRNALLDALSRHHGEGSNLGLIHALIMGDDPSEALTEVSMAFWGNYDAPVQAIRRADLTATEWDRHLVAFTPDLPSFLQDFALSGLLRFTM